MALRFIDGFDHAPSSAHLTKYFVSGGNTFQITTNPVRTGTGAASMGYLYGGFERQGYNYAPGTKLTLGFAFRTGGMDNAWIASFRELGIYHVGLGINSSGLLNVWLASGTSTTNAVLATGTTILNANSWYYLELQVVVHDTLGSIAVRVDGVPEPNLTLTNIDTRNGSGAAGNVTAWHIHGASNPSWAWYIDDLYFLDDSGLSTKHTTFLGPVKIETIYPQTDAVGGIGSNIGLTPSTGTDHGAMVDEVPPNTTDFNTGNAVGLKDTYNFPTPLLSGIVLGVQTNLYVAKADSVQRQVCPVLRSGGVDYEGASVAPLTTFTYFSQIWERNPNPDGQTDWQTADLVALEAGMKVTV